MDYVLSRWRFSGVMDETSLLGCSSVGRGRRVVFVRLLRLAVYFFSRYELANRFI